MFNLASTNTLPLRRQRRRHRRPPHCQAIYIDVIERTISLDLKKERKIDGDIERQGLDMSSCIHIHTHTHTHTLLMDCGGHKCEAIDSPNSKVD